VSGVVLVPGVGVLVSLVWSWSLSWDGAWSRAGETSAVWDDHLGWVAVVREVVGGRSRELGGEWPSPTRPYDDVLGIFECCHPL